MAGSCVHDVAMQPTGSLLQAKAALPALPGATYYLQVGGTSNDANHWLLRLEVDTHGRKRAVTDSHTTSPRSWLPNLRVTYAAP